MGKILSNFENNSVTGQFITLGRFGIHFIKIFIYKLKKIQPVTCVILGGV